MPGPPRTVEATLAFPASHPHMMRWMNVPFGQMLDQYFQEPGLKSLLSVLTGYLSDDPASLTVGSMAPIFGYYFEGGGYPVGSSQALAERAGRGHPPARWRGVLAHGRSPHPGRGRPGGRGRGRRRQGRAGRRRGPPGKGRDLQRRLAPDFPRPRRAGAIARRPGREGGGRAAFRIGVHGLPGGGLRARCCPHHHGDGGGWKRGGSWCLPK